MRHTTSEISESRWKAAQVGEAKYWHYAQANAVELARIIYEKAHAIGAATEAVPALADSRGPTLEIGIGPLGLGVPHFFPVSGIRIGVDPLPISRTMEGVPPPIVELYRKCWQEYVHVRARGEELPLPSSSMDNVFCYNVLDHVQNPSGILREGLRVLKPGGYLFLGCDALSLAGRVKYHLYFEPRHKDSIQVICHPIRFGVTQLHKMVKGAGFSILWASRRKHEIRERLIGHAFRVIMVARKPRLSASTCQEGDLAGA